MVNPNECNRRRYNVWSFFGAFLVGAACAAACGADEGKVPATGDTSGAVPGTGPGAAGGGASSSTQLPAGSTTVPADKVAGATVDIVTTSGNPFTGATLYVNPDYTAKVQKNLEESPAEAPSLEKLKSISTAIWLDKIAKVATVDGYLDDALGIQGKTQQPTVVTLVVYDLPDRDCAAKASNGELALADGGAEKYKSSFIDAIDAALKRHPNQRIVAVIEPDSLGNLATNLDVPKCVGAAQAYRDLVAYAIKTLAHPNVYLYVDAGHSGWLGWPDNQKKIATIYKEVLMAAGGVDLVRGFATNVANYTVLKETQESFDYQSNPCRDELTYAAQLTEALAAVGITKKGFLIDTSRNGRGGIRRQWGYWCNNEGAGLGERPVADPATGLDAYVWIKPPGESDGTSDPTAPRFDAFCAKENAAKNAPQAGEWFPSYLLDLVKNASPPLLVFVWAFEQRAFETASFKGKML